MTSKETHNMAVKALECLKNAVRKELQKKHCWVRTPLSIVTANHAASPQKKH